MALHYRFNEYHDSTWPSPKYIFSREFQQSLWCDIVYFSGLTVHSILRLEPVDMVIAVLGFITSQHSARQSCSKTFIWILRLLRWLAKELLARVYEFFLIILNSKLLIYKFNISSNSMDIIIDRAWNENHKNQNPGRQSREMGKSLGRESNFEEVCFELGTKYW